MYKLGARSKQRLKGVHDDLVRVVERAIEITTVDFTVLEGLRTPERQKALYESGASQTLNSRHITGHAVDLGRVG
jgi:peptidoglycan LD-endopeptidase CwlK